jgi:hypothetical protein
MSSHGFGNRRTNGEFELHNIPRYKNCTAPTFAGNGNFLRNTVVKPQETHYTQSHFPVSVKRLAGSKAAASGKGGILFHSRYARKVSA